MFFIIFAFVAVVVVVVEMSQTTMQVINEKEDKRIMYQTRFGQKKYKLTKAVLAKASVMA